MSRNHVEPRLHRLLVSTAVAAVVLLVAALSLARTATAQTLAPATASLTVDLETDDEAEAEAEAESEEGEEEADECESEDEAADEACLEAEEEREAEDAEAEECRIEGAEAMVAAVPGHDLLRLTVRYKTFQPSAVAIGLQSRGGKGALDLGTDTAHFGREGTLHVSRTLTEPQMARALAAREFTVAIRAVNSPGLCQGRFERHLTARKGLGAGLRWSDPSATRRAKASRA